MRYAAGTSRYVPIVQAQPWEYAGLWKDGTAYQAMDTILKKCPELRIVEVRGMFDLNTMNGGFWDKMKERGSVQRVDHHNEI